MFRKSLLLMLLSLSLFGCAAGSQLYTRDEEAAVMRSMEAAAGPKVYLYAKAYKMGNHMGNPFECTVDGNAAGGVKFGEYVVIPVKAGDHTVDCVQGVGMAALIHVKGNLALKAGKTNLYVLVNNGATTLSSLKLEASNTPPDKFNEEYQLSKTCTACSGNKI